MTEDDSSSENSNDGFALPVSEAWRRWRQRVDLDAYDVRWDQLEAQGQRVHDEADLVDQVGGQVILDAGCGTGRVAAELARRGKQVVGVDNDADMLAYAKRKPEAVRWELADLATMAVPEWFDTVVMAGNILVFVEPTLRQDVVGNLARHLKLGGHLVSGASRAEGCDFDDVDRWCDAAGLSPVANYATWDTEPFVAGGDYRVSVHRRAR